MTPEEAAKIAREAEALVHRGEAGDITTAGPPVDYKERVMADIDLEALQSLGDGAFKVKSSSLGWRKGSWPYELCIAGKHGILIHMKRHTTVYENQRWAGDRFVGTCECCGRVVLLLVENA